jgi:hypothetical protein
LLIPTSNFGQQIFSKFFLFVVPPGADILCNYIEDFKQFGGYFSSDPLELLKRIIRYTEIVTNRLHGGIPALGEFSAVKFCNSSNRVKKALEPFGHFRHQDGFYFIESIDNKEKIRNSYNSKFKEFYEVNGNSSS